jgi:two-component system, NarL family, nitrate/nitrite response regulator NarL
MDETIHLVIIDDHPLFREGVANTLRANSDIELVGEGTTADDAVRLAGDYCPISSCSTSLFPAAACARRR